MPSTPAPRKFSLRSAAKFLCFVVLGIALIPLLEAKQRESRRSDCQSNLKQIGLAFKQYTQDYDELFPVFGVPLPSETRDALSQTHWVRALAVYTKSGEIFQCPSEPGRIGTDYYYATPVSGANETSWNCSANSVMLCEGPDVARGALATASAVIKTGHPAAFARHLDGSNYAFIDGHVKWLQSTRAPYDSATAASGGGFTFGS